MCWPFAFSFNVIVSYPKSVEIGKLFLENTGLIVPTSGGELLRLLRGGIVFKSNMIKALGKRSIALI